MINRQFFFVDRIANKLFVAFDPNGRNVVASTRDRALYLSPAASGTTVQGLEISKFSPPHKNGTGTVVIASADNIRLTDVWLMNSAATAIVASGSEADNVENLQLQRVSVNYNGARGLSANRVKNLRIEYSRFDHNNIESFDYADCAGGTNCVLAGAKVTRLAGAVVRFSSFSDNTATGFWCDLDCSGLLFVGNSLTGNKKHGLYYEVSQDATVVSNVFARNQSSGMKMSGSKNLRIVRNTFYANNRQVNIAADFRNPLGPTPISFHTDPFTHMGGIDIQGNLFVEAQNQPSVIVYPGVDASNPPAQTNRFGNYNRNAYALNMAVGNPPFARFFTDNNQPLTTPNQFVEITRQGWPHRVWPTANDPASVFVDHTIGDFRIRPTGNTIYEWEEAVGIPPDAAAELDSDSLNGNRFPSQVGAALFD